MRFVSLMASCRWRAHPGLLIGPLCLGALAAPAIAQDAVTDAVLLEQLQARDAVIIELQRRLERLEQRLDSEGLLPVEEEDVVAPIAPQRSQPAVEVDELAAERALERTLVEEGALLLPPGQAEISPSFSFTHRNQRFPFLDGGQVLEGDIKRDEYQASLGLVVGLPFDAQLELGIPYNVVRQDVRVRGADQPLDSDDDWGNAIGDVSIGLAKTVWRENGGWAPNVVVRGVWDTNTGERFDGGVALDGGFNTVRGEVVALKRQDPLAFVGALAYSYTFEDDDVQPGQEFTLSLGANLAISPETSLSLSLNQSYTDEFEFDGSSVNGSDQTTASFDIGGSTIIGPRTLVRLVAQVGLTDDSPDYAIRASLAYRFNLPLF